MAKMGNNYLVYKRTIGEFLDVKDELIGSDKNLETAIGIAALAAFNTKVKALVEKHPDIVINEENIEVFNYIVTKEGDNTKKPLYYTEMYFRKLPTEWTN